MKILVKLILAQFSTGKWGFATKKPAPKVENSFFSGRLSTFNKKKGSAVSESFSPIPDCDGYVFLDDEYQDEESLKIMKETFKVGCFMWLVEEDGQLVDAGEEPLTLEDVKEQGLLDDVSVPASQSASIAS